VFAREDVGQAMTIGRKWFGKGEVATSNRQPWEAHDSTQTWTDGGAVRQVLDEAAGKLERIVAENATAAVADYVSTAGVALRATETGEVLLGLRIENDKSFMIVEVPLRKLMVTALMEVRPTIGVDPQAQLVVSALVTLGRQLASLGQPEAPAATVSPPPVPKRRVASA